MQNNLFGVYIEKLLIKIGVKKQKQSVGLKMRHVGNAKIDGFRSKGYDTAIDAEHVYDSEMSNVDVEK